MCLFCFLLVCVVKHFFHVYIECGYLLNSHLNFSGTQKPVPHSGLGSATCEEPEETEEADEVKGEGLAEDPIHTTPHTQTSGGFPSFGINCLPSDTIDKGSLLYKIGKQENK